MTDVSSDVIAIIGKKTRPQRTSLQPGDRLQDLGLGSLDAVELIFDLEEKFGINIPYNANALESGFETVGEVISAVESLVQEKK